MNRIEHSGDFPVPPQMIDANNEAWRFLTKRGNWWTDNDKLAIAREARNARHCGFCQKRKAALSPMMVTGEHDSTEVLAREVIDVVHRIVTDSSRLSGSFIGSLSPVIDAPAYVELLASVVFVLNVDDLHRGIGLTLKPLPKGKNLEPDKYLPQKRVGDVGWVPILDHPPPDAELDLYDDLLATPTYVLRALSVVPDAVRCQRYMENRYYLAPADVVNVKNNGDKSLNRQQIELVATRVSTNNECFYCSASHSLMLKVSADESDNDIDVGRSVLEGADDAGIEAASDLVTFVDALMFEGDESIAQARNGLVQKVGERGVVDTAGLVGSFQRMNRIANATGMPLDAAVNAMSLDKQNELGLREFDSAHGTNKPRPLLSWIMRKSRLTLFRLLASRSG